MKKVLLAAVFLVGIGFSQAQEAKDPMQDKDLMTWYHKDFATTKVYGVNKDYNLTFINNTDWYDMTRHILVANNTKSYYYNHK
jgi:hypothetical protein